MITIDDIKLIVADYFHLDSADLLLKTRKREIVQARQIAMYFSCEMTKKTLDYIGRSLGNKDHSTVLHACLTVRNLYDTDKEYRKSVDDIESLIKGLNMVQLEITDLLDLECEFYESLRQ